MQLMFYCNIAGLLNVMMYIQQLNVDLHAFDVILYLLLNIFSMVSLVNLSHPFRSFYTVFINDLLLSRGYQLGLFICSTYCGYTSVIQMTYHLFPAILYLFKIRQIQYLNNVLNRDIDSITLNLSSGCQHYERIVVFPYKKQTLLNTQVLL